MSIGKRLNKNSTLGVISPASNSPKIVIDKFLNDFHELGYNVKVGDCLYKEDTYLAGNDLERATELMNMFLDPDVDGIISFRGGFGSIRLLPYLDINIIKSNPKFFCGFSDLTILLNYFANNGLITFHGPMIKSNFNDPLTKSYFNKLMTNPSKGLIYDFKEYDNITESFSGYLRGGNLSMLCSAIGTPYEANLDNSILILEEINEPPYVIDRLLTQLILSNRLDKCNGIILGHFTSCSDDMITDDNILKFIKDRLSCLEIPILTKLPFGHDYPNITLPIGCYAEYDHFSNKLILCENVLF